jgi:tetratricopeptide (TPR) repeat protein
MGRHHSHRVEYAAPMPVRTRLRAFALIVCVGVTVFLPRRSVAEETSPANVAAARKHFERARTYYGQGGYRDAIVELEAAHALDPSAKDLVFNLGVVHEKLSDIDEALKWFRLYTTMDLLPQERDRADAYVRRLEGAKKELEDKLAAEQRTAQEPVQPPADSTLGPSASHSSSNAGATALPAPRPAPGSRAVGPIAGRVDGLTIGAASLSAAGLVLGAVAGVKALADRPPPSSITSSEYSFEQFRSHVVQAHAEAVVADIGFGTALVAGVATAYLYFGRPRAPATVTGSVSLAPLSGGGALILKGRF